MLPVSHEGEQRDSRVLRLPAGTDGRFVVEGMEPGVYTVVARAYSEEIDIYDGRFSDFIRQAAAVVEVRGDSEVFVELALP